ncbi:MAG: hypothetical protein DMF57_13460 [Acidobacteria bacterium]|nr:MAG: hypothetical protein DMF57_13460 [Acidobacteriota bacterium]
MIARRLFFVALVALLVAPRLTAQCVSLTTIGSAYTQDFNTLASSGTSNAAAPGWPLGWAFSESLANANTTYTAGTGSSNAGDTYSFGSAGSTERALGGLQSGTLLPTIGACFTNNTGSTVTSLSIAYTGEQWRLGTSGRGADRLDFQYSTNATSLTTGLWIDVDSLDFSSPITAGSVGLLNGNLAANRTSISSSVPSLAISNGATFWIRWNDLNASGADDGLAVDDFSLTAQGTVTLPNLSINDVAVAEGDSGATNATFTISLSSVAGAGPATFDIATQDNTATTSDSDYISKSLTQQSIASGSTSSFTVTINGDTKIEPDEMFFVNLTNVSGANVIRGQGIGTITNDDTSQPPTGVAAANPTTVRVGDATLLTVTVTPGTKPTSTGITVTGNLSAIGGSTTQTLYDDGTNGDATAGDNIFSYNATVSPSSTTGTKTLTFTMSDAQSRSSNASTSVKVAIAIHTIQGSGRRSPFEGQPIVTTGIVTGLRSNGFYIQEKDSQIDADPETSEGVFVFTSSAPPAAKGNLVSVSGTVSEFVPSADPNQLPVTEISFSPTVSLISTGNPLPAPINITSISSSILDQMERYEGMRVHVDSLTAIAPTGGTISEANATSTSSGIFYAVITGTLRPFREPGIELLDHAGWPATIPTFDENPERIRVDSGALGGTRLDVTTGQTLANVTGIVDYSFRTYSVLSETTLTTTSPAMTSTPVSQPSLSDFTVAAFNMERFFDTIDDPAISDVALTTTAFNNRLNKASLTIRNILRTPDIIGVEEMENLTTLQAVANKVNNDAVAAGQPNPNYTAYLAEGNDIGGIDVGFLVKSSRVDMVDVTQLGKSTTYTNPNNGLQELLNDRPPLILRAMVHSETNGAFRVTVIANHLRSLSGVDDPVDGPRVRAKRAAQAEFLANLIQARQVADPTERIVSIGDYNALGVNDGYVDSMNSIKGTPTPAPQVAVSSPDLVDPDLIDLVLPTQYSYVFDGNTQTLDHILINQNIAGHVEIAHNDADFPEIYRNDANRPERITDHDIPVAY